MTAMATRTSPKKKFNERNNGYGHALINLCTLYLDFFFYPFHEYLWVNFTFIQVRRLELEREQLLATIEALKTRHKDELTNIDSSHK